MADAYTYQKKRKEFGRFAQFEDTDTKIVGNVPPEPGAAENFIQRDPNKVVLSNIPQLSAHSVSDLRGFNSLTPAGKHRTYPYRFKRHETQGRR